MPAVSDAALSYLLYLLRDIRLEEPLTDNAYLRSVGLAGDQLHARLRAIDALGFSRQGSLTEFAWAHPDLASWMAAREAA